MRSHSLPSESQSSIPAYWLSDHGESVFFWGLSGGTAKLGTPTLRSKGSTTPPATHLHCRGQAPVPLLQPLALTLQLAASLQQLLFLLFFD